MGSGGSALSLTLLISAQDQASKIISQIGKSFGPVGGAIAGVSVAAIAAGAEAVKMAGDFQMSTTTLVTSAGESASQLGMVRQGILGISVATGTSTKQLVDGMYMIESAGFHGAAGLTVLRAAAQGAKAENANLGVVANAVTTVLTDYHMSANQATQATNALIVTVQHGKTHLQDLSAAMGNVLPLASALGIAFPQVAGALATMTNSGMSAQQASQNLAFAIRGLATPNAQAVKYMTEVGLSAQQVKDTMTGPAGLAGAIQLITDAVGKKFPAGSVEAVTAMKKIMGGAVGYNVALMLGGKNMAAYTGAVKDIGNAMNQTGKDVLGWSDIQGNLNFKWAQAKMAVDALMIVIGTALLPVVTQVVGVMAGAVTGLTNFITAGNGLKTVLGPIGSIFQSIFTIMTVFSPELGLVAAHWKEISANINPVLYTALTSALSGLQNILQGLANILGAFANWLQHGGLAAQAFRDAILGISAAFTAFEIMAVVQEVMDFIAVLPMIIGLLIMWAQGAWTAAAGMAALDLSTLAIGAGIAVAVTLILLAIQNWGAITAWLQARWQAFSTWFMGIWNAFAHLPGVAAFLSYVQSAWNTMVTNAQAVWSRISSGAESAWQNIKNGAESAFGNIGSWFQAAWQAVSMKAQQVGTTLGQVFQAAWKAIQSAWQQSPLASAWNTMVKAFSQLGPVILQTLKQQFGPIGQAFSQLGPTIKTQLAQAFAGLGPAFGNLGASFRMAWKSITDNAKVVGSTLHTAFQQAGQAISGALGPALKAVQQSLGQVGQAIGGAFGSAWKSLQQSFAQIGQTLKSTLVPAWNSLKQSLAAVGIAIGGAFMTAWKTLAPIFQQVGQAVGGAFLAAWKALAPILQQVGTAVGGAFLAAWKALQPVLAQIGPMISGPLLQGLQLLGMIIGGVILAAIGILLGLIVGLALGFASLVTGIANMIGGIITFFSGVIQAVSGIVAFIVDLCTGHFSKLGADLGVIWTGIQTMFKGVWMIIQGIFQATIGVVIGFVQGFVDTIVKFFTNLYNTLVGHSIVPDLCKAIILWFTNLWTTVVTGVTTFVANIIKWFTQMWTQAQTLWLVYTTYIEVMVQAWILNIVKQVIAFITNFLAQVQNFWQLVQTYWKVSTAMIIVLVQQWLANMLTNVQNGWNGIIAWITGIASKLISAIETPFQTAVNFVSGLFTGLQTTVSNIISGIMQSIGTINIPAPTVGGGTGTPIPTGGHTIHGFANGVANFTGGLAYVHQGEVLANLAPGTSVIPSRDAAHLGGGGVTNIVVNVPGRTRNEATTIANEVDRILARHYSSQLGTISTGGTSI